MLLQELEPVSKIKSKSKKVGVFLPVAYRGGSLQGAKNIAKMIHRGSRFTNEPIEVVFSCCEGAYSIEDNFSDLLALGISVRETKWKKITQREMEFIAHFRPHSSLISANEYLLPTDGISNFSDCDFWLLISDRLSPLIAPVVPYGMVIYDYIQRYVPGLLAPGSDQSFIDTARNAKFIITTTPQTQGDAIQYAGINPQKVLLMPMEFRPPCLPSHHDEAQMDPYFVWVTNPSKHKNHERAIKAIERYLFEGGRLDCLILGTNSHQLKETSLRFPKNCHILGEVSDAQFADYLSRAHFLWHPTLIDNGTFCVVEAAYLNVPSLSSDYPAMRYMNERFNLNLQFFNPYRIDEMANELKSMENKAVSLRRSLPTNEELNRFTAENLAPQFWQTLREWL